MPGDYFGNYVLLEGQKKKKKREGPPLLHPDSDRPKEKGRES